MKFLLILVAMLFAPVLALAQDAVISNDQFLMDLIQSIGGFKGASALAIGAIVAQLLVKLLRTPIGGSLMKNVNGKAKLIIVSVITIASAVLSLKVSTDISWIAALTHSSVLATISVYFHQFYKEFIEKQP